MGTRTSAYMYDHLLSRMHGNMWENVYVYIYMYVCYMYMSTKLLSLVLILLVCLFASWSGSVRKILRTALLYRPHPIVHAVHPSLAKVIQAWQEHFNNNS